MHSTSPDSRAINTRIINIILSSVRFSLGAVAGPCLPVYMFSRSYAQKVSVAFVRA